MLQLFGDETPPGSKQNKKQSTSESSELSSQESTRAPWTRVQKKSANAPHRREPSSDGTKWPPVVPPEEMECPPATCAARTKQPPANAPHRREPPPASSDGTKQPPVVSPEEMKCPPAACAARTKQPPANAPHRREPLPVSSDGTKQPPVVSPEEMKCPPAACAARTKQPPANAPHRMEPTVNSGETKPPGASPQSVSRERSPSPQLYSPRQLRKRRCASNASVGSADTPNKFSSDTLETHSADPTSEQFSCSVQDSPVATDMGDSPESPASIGVGAEHVPIACPWSPQVSLDGSDLVRQCPNEQDHQRTENSFPTREGNFWSSQCQREGPVGTLEEHTINENQKTTNSCPVSAYMWSARYQRDNSGESLGEDTNKLDDELNQETTENESPETAFNNCSLPQHNVEDSLIAVNYDLKITPVEVGQKITEEKIEDPQKVSVGPDESAKSGFHALPLCVPGPASIITRHSYLKTALNGLEPTTPLLVKAPVQTPLQPLTVPMEPKLTRSRASALALSPQVPSTPPPESKTTRRRASILASGVKVTPEVTQHEESNQVPTQMESRITRSRVTLENKSLLEQPQPSSSNLFRKAILTQPDKKNDILPTMQETWSFYKQQKTKRMLLNRLEGNSDPADNQPKGLLKEEKVLETQNQVGEQTKRISRLNRDGLETRKENLIAHQEQAPRDLCNIEDMWERSKLMKMKPSVLSCQKLTAPVLTPTNMPPELPTPSIASVPQPPRMSSECEKRSAEVVPPSPPPKRAKPDPSALLTDIMDTMEAPPIIPKLSSVPAVKTKAKKKKKKKKAKVKAKAAKKMADTENEAPPAVTYKSEEGRLADASLQTFLSAQNVTAEEAKARTKACIAALTPIADDVLVKIIVRIVLENIEEDVDYRFTPPAPPLTSTQHRLFALFAASPRFPPLYPALLAGLRRTMLPETFILPDDALESCARFHVALCRLLDEPHTALRLCVDVAAGMPQRGSVLINAVLAAWPEIVPLADGAQPCGPGATLALLVINTPLPNRLGQQASLQKLKKLLTRYYGYSNEMDRGDWAGKAVAALRAGDAGAGPALNSVCTHAGPQWVASAVVAPLLETLGVWQYGGASDDVACSVLRVLARALAGLPAASTARDQAVERLQGILLSAKVSHAGEEAIVDAILMLNKNKNRYVATLRQWTPKAPVSQQVLTRLQSALLRTMAKKNPKPEVGSS